MPRKKSKLISCDTCKAKFEKPKPILHRYNSEHGQCDANRYEWPPGHFHFYCSNCGDGWTEMLPEQIEVEIKRQQMIHDNIGKWWDSHLPPGKFDVSPVEDFVR